MANEEACAEMMEALRIEETYQRIEPIQSGSKLKDGNEDIMLDGTQTTCDTQGGVTPIEKGQRRNRDRRLIRRVRYASDIFKDRLKSSEFHDRCCLLCGYRAPHRMLLQVHLSTCRKTSSWPALYSSRPIESEVN